MTNIILQKRYAPSTAGLRSGLHSTRSSDISGQTARARIRVLCVDHHEIVLAGISASLKFDPRLEIVGLASSMPQAIEQFEVLRPDIVLTEWHLPNYPGVGVVETFLRIDAAARLIVLTSTSGDLGARRAIEAGASGFLLKSMSIDEIADAIESVHAGNRVLDPAVLQDVSVQASGRGNLSARELEVLQLIATGNTTVEIARLMHVAERTVRRFLSSTQRKLDAFDRTHAVMLARMRGLIDAESN